MESRLLYLIMVVAAGWAVTFGLRALPFILFAGKNRELPGWVEKMGSFVSPVIIGGLIVYSYATLNLGGDGEFVPAWKTVWPYLAGALTVGLQLWRRNPLVSIIVGTALYMFLVAGCRTTVSELTYDSEHPLIVVERTAVRFNGDVVRPEEVPGLLEDHGIGRKETIHIGIGEGVETDLRGARLFMRFLNSRGYSRTVLVTARHAESEKFKARRRRAGMRSSAGGATKIRYKKADE